MTKDDLRKLARQRRRAFLGARGGALFPTDGPGVDALLRLLPPGACIAGYVAMHSEADPADLLHLLHARGHPLALPWIGDEGSGMLFRRWTPGDPFEMAAAQFAQPLPSAPAVVPDIILLPMLGYDAAGNRLGQGAGHYDRALSGLAQALRIGLAWSAQAFDALPADPWDMPLDAVLTEADWRIFPRNRIMP